MTYDLTLQRFKEAVRRKETPPQGLVRKAGLLMTVNDIDQRQVRFTISTASVDREGDTIALDGWDLASYMKNPVVLWGHDASELPIGRCTAIGTEGDSLVALCDFVPADMPIVGPKAEAILRMCRDGFLSATSVGFRPTEFKVAGDRMADDDWYPKLDFLKQELLEFSVVSIPANPEALIDPSQRGSITFATAAELDALLENAAAATSALAEKHARRRLLRAACV
jgi:HK97 family phage prohead protease